MTCRDQRGHLLFSSKTQRLSTETTLVSIFAIQRQSSSIARRDEYGHLPPLVKDLMSFDRDCYSPSFCYPETTEFDGIRRPWWSLAFVAPRLSKFPYHPETSGFDGMRGRWWSSISNCLLRLLQVPLLSRDKRVRWNAETNIVICTFPRDVNVFRPRLRKCLICYL